ncbi:MAG: DUF3105 domain-containing protein [Dehalococcoidia bacterium]
MPVVRFVVVVLFAFLVMVLLAACGGGGSDGGDDTSDPFIAQPVDDYPYPAQMFPAEIGAEGRHFAPGEFQGYGTQHYDTNPPTSGRHIGELVQAGIYDTIVPNEIAVHNMEHGFVIAWYNCNAGAPLSNEECATLRNELSSVVQPAVAGGQLVVQTPNPTIDHRIVLTAWQFMDSFEDFDADRINQFIETFECHYDPEGTC